MIGPIRILVVDNNLADQEMIREMLPTNGIDAEVIAVMEGGEAIDFLESAARGGSEPPDIILLDLHLSRMHGREVLSFVRGDPRLRDLPVIMFTTASTDEIRADCLRLGADDFLLKPRHLSGFSEIAAAIKRLVASGRPQHRLAE